MKLYEVQDRSQPLLDTLLDIWEQSVRATHLFLSAAEVKAIRAYVPQAMRSVEHLIVAENEQPIAFRVLLSVREFKLDRVTGGAETYTYLGT